MRDLALPSTKSISNSRSAAAPLPNGCRRTCRADTLEGVLDDCTRNLSLGNLPAILRDDTLDLAAECCLVHRIHSTPRPLVAAIPSRKRLAKPERVYQLRTGGLGQPTQPLLRESMDDTGGAPVSSASGVSELCYLVSIKAFPTIRPGTSDPAAIPKSLRPKSLDFKERTPAVPHAVERPDAFVGVL